LVNRALHFRSVTVGALSSVLALFAGACGDPDSDTGTPVMNRFEPPAGMEQPAPSNQPGDVGGPETPEPAGPSGTSSPETQPVDVPLAPGMTPPASGTGEVAPPADGMTPPAETPPAETPPGMEQPPQPEPLPPTLERPSRGTPNLFTSELGIPVGEVDAKLTLAVNRYFGIGTNESETPVVDTGFRVFYELPQDRSMAFIWTTDTNEVRSEGQSYGMMIAVQMNMQEEFDKLWKFAKTFMQYGPNAPEQSWRNCFHWVSTVNSGNPNNWQFSFNEGPAPDGDQYFAAALYLADRRWTSGGAVNYEQEADNISHAMLANPAQGTNTPLINAGSNLVVFFPNQDNQFTDPSYNLPAFYELYALDGPQGDAQRWNTIADASRNLIVRSAHPVTGLHPDYSTFQGAPVRGNAPGDAHDTFRYDAWRVVMNMAVDYAWFDNRDARWTEQANKYHAFFTSQLTAAKDGTVNQTYNLDGSGADGGNSTALTATLAAGAIASTAPNRLDFVNAAWRVYQQTGEYRYYQESVYILGLLATSGMMGYEWTAQ
jgi:oligosaccharide reducing-end xylanase